jgi:cysteinyl-tRNA synthetase
MKLYNTLTKKVENIVPIDQSTVTIYTCGPTVYDYPHIGNWFTFIRYDLLVKALKNQKLSPKWVLNITDVGHLVSDSDSGEDKLEKGAKREGKTAWEIADFYTKYFLEGINKLGIDNPDYLPKATDHIKEQINLIKRLEEKGFTYEIDDGIYYDTSKFPQYNDFAQLDVDEQQAGKRVEFNPQKRNITDFALWKFSPKNAKRDMEWDSPWGVGFPGWHIECSAMSMKYLGETIDIHAGGIDHLPIHHTNEIAQSQAATGKKYANYWMHTNHILIEENKISKSLGNGIVLEDISNKGFSLSDFRYLVLQSHYRTQSQFSWEILSDAAKSLDHLRKNFSSINRLFAEKQATSKILLNTYREKILTAIKDDLNTPIAISLLHECALKFSKLDLGEIDKELLDDFNDYIWKLLGINIYVKTELTDKQIETIKKRERARGDSDWEASDNLRTELENEGILLNDTKYGPTWYKNYS